MMRLARLWQASLAAVFGMAVVVGSAGLSYGQGSACTGDCDASGEVTVDDILKMVNIALGLLAVDDCTAGDSDGSGDITVDEITQAVNNANNGCPVVTPTPTPGPLGTKHFTLDPAHSRFQAAIAPGFVLPIGMFQGQTNGVVGPAFLDLEAGEPDAQGFATINVTGSSEYLFADASAFAPLVICLRPIVPVMSAGVIDCNGTIDFSIVTSIDHNIGEIGVDGFSPADCANANGTIEGPNQICAAGTVGMECATDSECDTAMDAGDGVCGLSETTCTAGKVGEACRNDEQCDTEPGAVDGTCGQPGSYPGVCNGPLMLGQAGITNRPGEVNIAPIEEFGLNGLPVELTLESATPCGDEGPGMTQPFALTTSLSRTTVFNFNNGPDDFVFDQTGLNFDCKNWQSSPGRFVLSIAVLNQFNGGDVITGFEFGSALPTPTPTGTPSP